MPDFISMSSLPLIRQLIKLNNEGSSYYYYQHFRIKLTRLLFSAASSCLFSVLETISIDFQ